MTCDPSKVGIMAVVEAVLSAAVAELVPGVVDIAEVRLSSTVAGCSAHTSEATGIAWGWCQVAAREGYSANRRWTTGAKKGRCSHEYNIREREHRT